MFVLADKKRCSKCEEWKDRSEFGKDKKQKDGLSYWCKECNRKNSAKYRKENHGGFLGALKRWREKNKEKKKEYRKKWYSENREHAIDYAVKYAKENAEHINQRRKQHRQAHREKFLEKEREQSKNQYNKNLEVSRQKNNEKNRRWRLTSPEKAMAAVENRRAKRLKMGGRVTEKEWKDLCEKYGYKCLCCKRTDVLLTMDHIIPLDPGPHTIDNIQPLCGSCNTRKGRRTIDYR
jgi:5-methylcytosine-specific restriction endonuclease McrA